MFQRYRTPLTAASVGGVLGWMIAHGLNQSGITKETYAPYIILITAFAAIGGRLCLPRNKPLAPVTDIADLNTKLLAHLDAVFDQAPVALLTQKEFEEYQTLMQHRSMEEIVVINVKIENYQAAIDAICPNLMKPTRIRDLTSPITLFDRTCEFLPVTYDFINLRKRVEESRKLEIIEIDSGMVINPQNFYFEKNYVPEIMDFLKEVRTTLSKHMQLLAPHNPELIFFNINPAKWPLPEQPQAVNNYGATKASVALKTLRT